MFINSHYLYNKTNDKACRFRKSGFVGQLNLFGTKEIEVNDLSANTSSVNKGALIKWGINILVPLILFLIPETEVYTYQVKMFLIVTIAGILMVAFEQVNLMAVSMLFPIGYMVTGLVPMEVAYSAWLQTMPLVVIGGYMIAMVLNRIGLLKRMAYWCFIKVRGSYYGLLYSVFIVGCILNTVTGGNAWVMMAAFTFGLCMGFELGVSIDSAIIMLVGGLSAGASCMFIYSPYFMSLIWNAANQTLPEGAEQYGATWIEFFWQNLPYLIFCLVFIWLLPKIFKPKHKLPDVEYFKAEYQKLGKMEREEKIGAILTVLLIIFMLTGNIHGIALDWGFIVLPWLMFFPGIHIATEEDVKGVDWSMVFFCIACLSIGTVSSYLGIGELVADLMVPALEGMGSNVVMIAIYVVAVVLNFLLTPLAILAGFSEPIAQIAAGLGLNPVGALYSLFLGCDQVLLPYEYLTYMIFYGFGLIKLTDFMKVLGLKMALATVLLAVVMIPWWHFVGVL